MNCYRWWKCDRVVVAPQVHADETGQLPEQEAQPVADNTTRSGREQNRRVEVKVLVNRGLIQGAPNMTRPSSDNPGGNN